MTAADDDPSAGPDLVALRRRLYAPDATEDDRARYAAALAPTARAESGPTPDAPTADAPKADEGAGAEAVPGRSPRRAAVVVAAAVVVLLVAVAGIALALLRPAAPRAAPTPDTAVALSIPPAVRSDFATSLDEGDGMDLADYIEDHPEVRPPQLTTLTRAATEEHAGTGGATVSLSPSTEADAGGRLTVILTLGTRVAATWRAARVSVDRVQQVASHTATQPAGQPCSVTVPYSGRAPTLLSISAPRGTRWDALVVFSN